MEKCCGEVLRRSVVEKLWGSVVEKCCEEVLWRSVVKELWRSVVKEW